MNYELDTAIRASLMAFAMKAFAQLNPGSQLVAHQYMRYLASHLESVRAGKVKRLCIALPPRHAKTFLASVAFAAWVFANKPATKILLVSYGQELADKIAYDVRRILQSDWYCRLFRTRISKGRSKLTDFVTTAGGGLRSVSVEGGVTGLGADLIVVDDAVQIKDCENVKQLARINDLFDSEIRTRLNSPKRGAIVVVAHRLAEDDLTGHLKKEGGWKLVQLPLIARRSRVYQASDGFVWHRQKGELLRPDAFTMHDIDRLRSMKRPSFETLQQQNPGARERLAIRAEHLSLFDPAELPADHAVVLSIDPGQKTGPSNSFGVVQCWTVHRGQYKLFDQWREQSRYADFRHAVFSFIRRYRPSAILVEATGQGPALISDIKPQQGMEIFEITPFENKAGRLRKHRKIIRSGMVSLSKTGSWVSEFVTELTLFPYGAFDDQVDAMTQFLDWIAEHPVLIPRPPRALAAAAFNGTTAHTVNPTGPAVGIPGMVWVRPPFGRRG